MANTLLLHPDTNDLLLDANRNIALASEPYANAQDVASACKLFQGEAYYNILLGVPYFSDILGYQPQMPYVQRQYELAALSVPNIVSAKCTALWYSNRSVSGNIQVINTAGQAQNVQFS